MQQKITSFADVDRVIGHISAATKRYTHTLDHMFELLEFLGNPQKQFKVIHVAGTSGKTSTAYYAAALLGATGKKVGLTISPHAYEVNERVQINLTPLPEAVFCGRFAEFLEAIKPCRVTPNYFETFIAFAFWEFAAQKVDYAVVEVGIGGLLDSTNVFADEEKVCVITDIGLDHMALLGDTVTEIAGWKAGIIQLHNAVFCNAQGDEVIEVVRTHAAQKQADLHILNSFDSDISVDFLPLFQQRNFRLSLAAAQYVVRRDSLPTLSEEMILEAARTYIPARMEVHKINDKTVILDIAHNSQKLHALLESVRDKYPGKSVAALIRMPASEGSLPRMTTSVQEVTKGVQHIIVTSLAEAGDAPDKSFSPDKIAVVCKEAGYDSFEIIADPKEAFGVLRAREEPVLVVTGSTFLMNHIRSLV